MGTLQVLLSRFIDYVRERKAQRVYVNRACEGHCVHCDSHEIEGDFVEVNAGSAWQQVSCLDCNSKWIEHYTLSRVEIDEEVL